MARCFLRCASPVRCCACPYVGAARAGPSSACRLPARGPIWLRCGMQLGACCASPHRRARGGCLAAMLRAVRVPLAVWKDSGLPGWRNGVVHDRSGGMPCPPAATRLRLLTELGACVPGVGDCQAVGESQRVGILSRDARSIRQHPRGRLQPLQVNGLLNRCHRQGFM